MYRQGKKEMIFDWNYLTIEIARKNPRFYEMQLTRTFTS